MHKLPLISLCLFGWCVVPFLAQAQPRLVINEIHADPADPGGDANGDGERDSSEDEFVEIYNTGSSAVDVSGFTLEDEVGVRHTFPASTVLDPGTAITVFGGGTPTDVPSHVQTASAGLLGLNNGGDTVTLKTSDGTVVDAYTYGPEGGDDQSLTRDPDFTGSFVKHTTATGSGGARYSPGRTIGGTPLPVELTDFDAVAHGTIVDLTWHTASETNNAGFEIQETRKGRHEPQATDVMEEWTKVAFVEGAGTTHERQQYRYRVDALAPGAHAFRLKQIDVDGTASYSPVVEVTLRTNAPYALKILHPNPLPAGQDAHLMLTADRDQPITISLYNALGQRVRRIVTDRIAAHTPTSIRFRTAGLPSGLYLYRIEGPAFQMTRRFTLVR